MTIAIYSRKSKMTETGDSIKNQINICKDYANKHFGACEFIVYEDEGFSGGNTDRPMFQSLIKDAHNKKFDVLVCYRLDRVSRNIHDFSTTLELLDENRLGFVSVTEQFDTTTPMGKAMMYIASVFAQLERDTIAQRITDNFSELVKTGQYLLGTPPEGLRKKRIIGENGKSYNILEIVPEEAEKIKMIYENYLKWQSITKVWYFCAENKLTTKKGVEIKPDWISRILEHQLYTVADEQTYAYFQSLGVQIVSPKEAFDGTYGISVYRRLQHGKRNNSYKSSPDRLIIGVGQHKGIIASKDWITVQNIIQERKNLSYRKPTGGYGILNGLLYCSHCGSRMKPTSIHKTGRFSYVCSLKERSRKKLCTCQNLAYTADESVVYLIKHLLENQNTYRNKISSNENVPVKKQNYSKERSAHINNKVKQNEKSIENLIIKLSQVNSHILIQRITQQVEKLDAENSLLKQEALGIENEKHSNELEQVNMSIYEDSIKKLFSQSFDLCDVLTKRNILKIIFKRMDWDGNQMNIDFFMPDVTKS